MSPSPLQESNWKLQGRVVHDQNWDKTQSEKPCLSKLIVRVSLTSAPTDAEIAPNNQGNYCPPQSEHSEH